jgi:hypothetical protein
MLILITWLVVKNTTKLVWYVGSQVLNRKKASPKDVPEK